MDLNLSVCYGLAVTGYLTIHADKGWVQSSEISKECQVPSEYLLRILQQMSRHTIVIGKRGPRGGFKLARPAAVITLLEVIEAAGGPMAHKEDITELTADTPLTRNLETVCRQASEKEASILSKVTLRQLAGQ